MLKPTPLFTFKHYAAIIRVLRALDSGCKYPESEQDEHDNGIYHQKQNTINAFADMFAADNPRFKRELFMAECNREEAK